MDCFGRFALRNDGDCSASIFQTTSGYESAFSRHDVARGLHPFRPSLEKEGAGKAGCALHPRSRVQIAQKKRTRAYRSSGDIPAFPARWFTAYFELSPVTGLFCHRRFAEMTPQNLAPASGRQDHTTSPSALACARRSQAIRVHRIPPRVRDDAQRPSHRVRRASGSADLPDGLSGIFFSQGLDRLSLICPSSCFVAPADPTSPLRVPRSDP